MTEVTECRATCQYNNKGKCTAPSINITILKLCQPNTKTQPITIDKTVTTPCNPNISELFNPTLMRVQSN